MKRHLLSIVLLSTALTAMIGAHALDLAGSSGGGFEISWYTIDGGGGTSVGGDFEVSGTIGQHDAGDSSGGDFALSGGFWGAAGDPPVSCVGDITGPGGSGPDNEVNGFDLLALLACWGPVTPGCAAADISGPGGVPNGIVDGFDLLELLANWGPCP